MIWVFSGIVGILIAAWWAYLLIKANRYEHKWQDIQERRKIKGG